MTEYLHTQPDSGTPAQESQGQKYFFRNSSLVHPGISFVKTHKHKYQCVYCYNQRFQELAQKYRHLYFPLLPLQVAGFLQCL